MSDRSLVRLGRAVAVATLVVGAVAAVILVAFVPIDRVSNGQFQTLAGTPIIPVIVLIALPRVPRNGSIWGLAVAGAALSLSILGDSIALSISDISSADITASMEPGADPILTAPADLPTASAVGLMLSMTMWIPSFVLVPTMVLLLFPDGLYPRREQWWRWIGIATLTTMAIGIPALLWEHRPSSTVGYTEIQQGGTGVTAVIGGFAGLAVMVLVLLSIVGYIVKWRQSEGEQRIQYRWVGFVFLMFAAWQLTSFLLGGFIDAAVLDVVSWVSIAAVPAAYAVAITKYRLYDIDLVVSRTLVYGVLIALIAVVYVAIVAVPLFFVGESETSNAEPAPVLAIGATALIAIAFQPVRRRLERAANRIVYGKRATPYEVLSEFTRRVAATDDDLLEQVPESLVAGTSAETAAVWVRNGSAWSCTNSFPADAVPQSFPGFVESANGLASVPVENDGEIMGAVTLQAPRAQRLSPDDERLARQVASGMGLALRNQRLTEDLRNRVELLRDSRRRIVAVQDDTRRDLERDLHDGAQQQLVAVKVKLGIARQLAERDSAEATISAVTAIAGDADRAIDDMRAFARGVYPPLLEAEGLVAALTAQARRLPITVEMSGSVERHGRDVESTMYFCVVEALRNVVQHSRADLARVALGDGDSVLTFAVTDAGPGFDPARTLRGSGLVMMEDRLDVLGGTLIVGSTPTGPTSIQGTIPTDTHPMRSAPFSGVAP